MIRLTHILDMVIIAVCLALLCSALAGCAAPRSSDPYNAATGVGLARIETAADAAKWSNDRVVKLSVGDAKILAQTTDHALSQVKQGAQQASSANAASANHVRKIESENTGLHASYDNAWTGGRTRRIWARVKLAFWIIVGVIAADWIVVTFFSTSVIGAAAKAGWGAFTGLFSLLWRLIRPRGAAVVDAVNPFMSPGGTQ